MNKSKFVEIFFDAENVEKNKPIGSVTKGLWKLMVWDLKNNEPIIESGIVVVEKSSFVDCKTQAKIYANDLKSHGFKVYVSGNSPNSTFPIKSVYYETFIYNRRLL